MAKGTKDLNSPQSWQITPQWTLFLDRDGVINRKIDNSYVLSWSQFIFSEGAVQAIKRLTTVFGRIVGVTNQQGIGKGLMTNDDFSLLMRQMADEIHAAGGKISTFYYCPHLENARCTCRKPRTGMARQAKQDFPDINFSQSVMVGDSISDMRFGRNLDMKTVFITNNSPFPHPHAHLIDAHFPSLETFADAL